MGSDAVVMERAGHPDPIVYERDTLCGQLSVTVIVGVYVPVAVGVPLITPDEELILKPAGRPVAVHEYGVTPPAAVTVAEYVWFFVALGSDAVVMESAGHTELIVYVLATLCGQLSVTVIVGVYVPVAVGVPLIVPDEEPMLKPVGRPLAVHEYGVTPPPAVTVVE